MLARAEDLFSRAKDSIVSAIKAHVASASHVAEAAKVAKTPQERDHVAQAAAVVDDQQRRIAAAIEQLQRIRSACGIRTYTGVTSTKRDLIFGKLRDAGLTVTGDDPWDVEYAALGVKLRVVWDPQAQLLKAVVTNLPQGFPCSTIWDLIDGQLKLLGVASV